MTTSDYTKWYDAVWGQNTYTRKEDKGVGIVWNCVKDLSRERKILDVGCGRGHYVRMLIKGGFKNTLGLEASGVCAQMHLQETPRIVSDFVSFAKTQETGSFDTIICMGVLEHIKPEDIDEFLYEISRLSNHAILSIANHEDYRKNIVKLHLIVEPWPWWENKLKKLYSEVSFLGYQHKETLFFCECKK